MEKKKTLTLTIIGLFIFLFSIVGLTYAYWSRTLTQEDKNLVYSDCLQLDVSWGSGGFTLTNAYPMTNDELVNDFFPNQEPYTFTITNSCDKEIPVSINMESLTADAPELKDDYVDVILWEGKSTEKMEQGETEVLSHVGSRSEMGSEEAKPSYKLTANKVNSNKLITDAKKAYQLYKFKLGAKDTKSFNLLLFMDYDTPVSTSENVTNNANWAGKITLNNYTAPTSIIRKREDTNSFWQYQDQITKVVFEDQLSPKDGAAYSFDESEAQNQSIMSYLVPDEVTTCYYDACYIAYIQGNGGVVANKDSSHFFDEFENLKSIEGLEHLDTSQVENMSYMFAAGSTYVGYDITTSELTILDVSSLDTSKVTDMSGMFSKLVSLTTLTLGANFNTSQVKDMHEMFESCGLESLSLGANFNTGQVENMSYMFSEMENLQTLDLRQSQFDTSYVTDMSYMFGWMNKLRELYLGDKFNASNVTDMDEMFASLNSLQTLDLGNNFNPLKITDMSNMFSNLKSLQTLNLGNNFNTRNVTNMNYMFFNCQSLTSLNLGNAFDTSQVTNMNSMFLQLYALPILDLGKLFDTRNVTNMDSMFGNDEELRTITYGDNFIHNTEANTEYMFGGGCPANLPTHDSWKGTDWYGGTEDE